MEECESLDSEMTELQQFQSEAESQDDEDEVEELQNSLREVVQDPSVKPKLQCLMVDPSFSMVTVQSEDSGIVWETASSRCSTPWASETSSTSEAYSMEGQGAAGKITIVFDEEKIVRRRTRSGGRSSRLGDRFSRPGSSRSASALGVERPEMAEVSLPNVKQEKTQAEPDLEEIKNKDQQLFSLISEGYEILNIRVPSKLPTVDEEESTELQDNLSYLDQTPKIRSKNNHDWMQMQNHAVPEDGELPDHKESEQGTSQTPTDSELSKTPTPKESGGGDIDYFEKFTLLDVSAPADETQELHEEAEKPAAKSLEEEQKPAKETATDSPSVSEDSFVFVTDVEIVGEHLDEVFYGEGPPPDTLQRREDEEAEEGGRMRMRRESQRSVKENGSVLFGSQETILTPIFISPGPPKIIDPILLEEPTAMSFMYSDLYEDAVGERRKSDEECSEAESVASEKSYKRRLSDCEETDGYLEKFTLKDETPIVEDLTESVKEKTEGRVMWSQSKFEMTGCLTKVVREEDKEKAEEPQMQEVSVQDKGEDLQIEAIKEEVVKVPETATEKEETNTYIMAEEESATISEVSMQESKPTEDQVEFQEVKQDIAETPKSTISETTPEAEQVDAKAEETEISQTEVQEETASEPITETGQTQEVGEKATEVDLGATEVNTEATQAIIKSEIPTESPEKSLLEEVTTDDIAVVEEAESEIQEKHSHTEAELSVEKLQLEEKDAKEVIAPIEVITDCDPAVHAVVEVTERAADEKDIQTQVQIDLQDVKSAGMTEAVGGEELQATREETALESKATGLEWDTKVKTEIPCESEVKTESETKEAVESEQHQQDEEPETKVEAAIESEQLQQEGEPESKGESEETKLRAEPKDDAVGAAAVVQEMVNVGEELIVFVPRGQAVEMDIEISPSQRVISETPAVSEFDRTCEQHTASETISVSPELLQEPEEETIVEPQQDSEPEVILKDEVAPGKECDDRYSITVPVEEADTKEQKMEQDLDKDKGTVHQEDLSELHKEGVLSEEREVEQNEDRNKGEDVLETTVFNEESIPEIDLQKEGEGQKMDVLSPLENFTLQEDRSGLHQEDLHSEELDTKQKEDIDKVENFAETTVVTEYFKPEIDLQNEEKGLKVEDLQSEEPEVEQNLDIHKIKGEDVPETNTVAEDFSQEISLQEEEEGQKVEVLSPLRSFTPLEDLSGLHKEDLLPEVEQEEDLNKIEDVPEINFREEITSEAGLQREETGQKEEQDKAVTVEAKEVTVDELEYEMIYKQDAEMPQPETQRDTEEPKVELDKEKEEEVLMEAEVEKKEEAFSLSPDEELIEADYDIIDAEEERQAKLAAELQGMDWFCLTCGCLLSQDDCASGEHHNHEMTSVEQAYEEIKEKLGDWISELQGRSENIEDLVSELELGYNSVEDQFVECEAVMQAQNDEMMALVMEQYNSMSVSMEEEKKAKLEQLYDQIVSFQESIDSAKATLETTAREAETEARSPEDIQSRLTEALDSAMSLELGPRGLLVFEDYAKGNTSSSHLAQRKGIPVPQRPTLQPQEAGSASSTSVTVYWKVNPGDIIDCFQVYCMEDPQGAVSEEYRVTVKESYCALEELEPDKTYKVWVMAVNYTGCSLPSERLSFRTAPSVPVIDTERCAVLWDSATLRWSSSKQIPEQTFTLEYCRQYELEGEGVRMISGIRSCEQMVLLQPNENYLFYIKAVNEAGTSEQSEAALISTKGTKFGLLTDTAHPALELSVDETTVHFSQDYPEDTPSTDKMCPSILGELLPCRGQYYWETVVSGSTAYRLGVAYSSANRNSPLGENSQSWCLQCIPTPSSCSYQLLHNSVQSSVFVIDMPVRVGTLLDYQLGRLSFYNTQTGQLLGSFCQRFTQMCHPALALELPGRLEVSMVPEIPEFTKDS